MAKVQEKKEKPVSSVKRVKSVTSDKKTEKTEVGESPRVSNAQVTLDVYDTKGQKKSTVEVSKTIFGAAENKTLLAQAVRVYLSNQRQGTVSTKTRGEVTGSTRKIYKQKGTGRARHGGVRAPIFVHGGLVFGPKPRDYSLDLPKKMKRVALFASLSAKVRNNALKVVSGMADVAPKTKEMVSVLTHLEKDMEKILVVVPEKTGFGNVVQSTRNIEGVEYIYANMLSCYLVLNASKLVVMKEALPVIEKTFLKEKKDE